MIKKILVSQPKPSTEKSPYYDIAERYGCEVVFRPFIKIEGITPREFRKQKINLSDFTAVIFTSRYAIDNFFQLCQEMRVQIPETMKYFCITEAISHYIQHYVQYRKRKVFWGSTGKVDDLIPQMLRHKNERYFVPQSDVHTDEVKRLLDSKGLTHTEGVMYRTVSNDFTEEEKANFDYDMLVFFSPSGVRALLKNMPAFVQGKIAIAAFGASTCQEVRESELRLDVEAPTPACPSMTMAIGRYVAQQNEE